MARLKQFWALAKESVTAWSDDYAPSMGAALAYYSLFSIAPLLLIAITIAGFFFGAEAARGEILEQMRGLIGEEGGVALEGLLKSASEPANGVIGMVTGIVLLIVGATTVVTELVWLYYSAQIFLLGAEFTWVYAHRFGSLRGTRAPTAAPRVPRRPQEPVAGIQLPLS